MIDVYIYLDKTIVYEEFVEQILKENHAAKCSIDIDNSYYELINGELVKKVHVVVTAQINVILFQTLSEFVENYYGKNVSIFSSP